MIAGWSGGYDYALRDLLMPPGAYPTYWLEPYSPHKDAKAFQEVRAATMIQATADEGFDRLDLKLEALLRDTPPPRSAKETSREVKRLLSEPQRYAIQLDDYLQELGISLTDALKGDRYIPSVWPNPSEDAKFLESGLRLAAPAAAALATVVRYDQDRRYENLLSENFELLERYSPSSSTSSGAAKILALRSVPFAVLCVLADREQYTRLTEVLCTLIRFQHPTKRAAPLVMRLVQIGLIPENVLQGPSMSPFLGFRAMKDVIASLPRGLLRQPAEALYLTEFLTVLTYLQQRKGDEARFWLTNYMYDTDALATITDFLQRSDINHNEILPNFRNVLSAHDNAAHAAFSMSPYQVMRGFGSDAVLLYNNTHGSAE